MRTRTTTAAAALAACLAVSTIAAGPPSDDVPRSGVAVPALASFDRMMSDFLVEHECPGATLCIARKGRIIFERGYGYADPAARTPMPADATMRIASISKPLTAVAVLRLAEAGRLSLDANPFVIAGYAKPLGEAADTRLAGVTVRMLLHHTAGWDRGQSYDPMFAYARVAKAMGASVPYDHDTLIRYMLTQPLDFEPGSRYAYSNFGYCVLGRVIEAVTGEPYETHVRRHVLAPVGADGMFIGGSLPDERREREPVYVARRTDVVAATKDRTKQVPVAYGHDHELMDAHGAWVGSAADLVRFAVALEEDRASPLLGAEALDLMIAPPEGPAGHTADGAVKTIYYGAGWSVRRLDGGADRVNIWHTGAIPGTASILVHLDSGMTWAVLLSRGRTADGAKWLGSEIDGRLHEAARQVERWPDGRAPRVDWGQLDR